MSKENIINKNVEDQVSVYFERTIPKAKLIPLQEWAKKQGIHPATARQKAGRGGYKTAIKMGRDWVISSDEENVDLRKKENRGQ